MPSFCASSVPVTGGCKRSEQCFAAAVGSKKAQEEQPSVPQIPEENSFIDSSLFKSTHVVGSLATNGSELVKSLASFGSITTARIEEAFKTVSFEPEEDEAGLLSVVQGTKLFAAQRSGNSSILRCSELGNILHGLVTIPLAQEQAPGQTEVDIDARDSYVLLGSTVLLEGFSQANLTKIFSEHSETGTAAIVDALLKQAVAFGIAETVNVIVLDIRGWVAMHAADTDAARAMKSDGASTENESSPASPKTPQPEEATPSAEAVEQGMSNVAAGVTNGASTMPEVPAKTDVAAGVATVAEGVQAGADSAKIDSSKGETGTKDGPKEEIIDPNAPWHTKMIGTAKNHWSTHKGAIMKFAKSRKKTASKDAKKVQGFFGKCVGGGKDDVLHEDDDVVVPVSLVDMEVPVVELQAPVVDMQNPIPEDLESP